MKAEGKHKEKVKKIQDNMRISLSGFRKGKRKNGL